MKYDKNVISYIIDRVYNHVEPDEFEALLESIRERNGAGFNVFSEAFRDILKQDIEQRISEDRPYYLKINEKKKRVRLVYGSVRKTIEGEYIYISLDGYKFKSIYLSKLLDAIISNDFPEIWDINPKNYIK